MHPRIPSPIAVRVAAGVAALAIASALFATIAATMPPDLAVRPSDAGNAVRGPERTEVAIVPSRIDVVGTRSEDTAANDGPPAAPAPRS